MTARPPRSCFSPPVFLSVSERQLGEKLVRSFALRIVVVLLATVVLALPAQAQRRRMSGGRAVAAERPQVGAHIGYNFDFSEAVIGAQATFPVARQVDLYPSFDFYTVSGGSLWAVNLDGRFKPPMRSAYATLYVGAVEIVAHMGAHLRTLRRHRPPAAHAAALRLRRYRQDDGHEQRDHTPQC